jgi:hypothetical protein
MKLTDSMALTAKLIGAASLLFLVLWIVDQIVRG